MMPRLLPAALCIVAALTTTVAFILHAILANGLTSQLSSVRSGSILAAFLESVVLLLLAFLFSTYLSRRCKDIVSRWSNIFFAAFVLLSTAASISSVATLISLSNEPKPEPENRILGSGEPDYLVGAGIALGLALASQLLFVVMYFVIERIPGLASLSIHADEEAARPHSIAHHVKSIRYSQTMPTTLKMYNTSTDSHTPPGSSGGRSAAETMSSIRASFSHVVRPITSRTRLISTPSRQSWKSQRSQTWSIESRRDGRAASSHSVEENNGFDSWDTSSVDPRNRETVLESSSPVACRFLETIPASPSTSRSPSPGFLLDQFEPPRPAAKRSRSYSPVPRRPRAPYMHQHPSPSESHIHPLFRSDSPTPPPIATPGTVVHAAPNAGQIISDRSSIRSLSRMRSDSFPNRPSPFSRQGSFDDTPRGREKGSCEPESPKIEEDDEGSEKERKMTPPIPEWILSAGSRTSLTDYYSRKLRQERPSV